MQFEGTAADSELCSLCFMEYRPLSCHPVNLPAVNDFLILRIQCMEEGLGLMVSMRNFSSKCAFAQCVCASVCALRSWSVVLPQAPDWQQVASVAENPWPSSLTFTLTAVSPLLIYCDANLISARWPPTPFCCHLQEAEERLLRQVLEVIVMRDSLRVAFLWFAFWL